MGYKIIITDHAFNRLRERSGINKKASVRLAEKAYSSGIKHSDVSGRLYKYVSSITGKTRKGADIRIYGDKVYIFNNRGKNSDLQYDEEGNRLIFLVTVMQIPNNLSKNVIGTMSKKNEKSGGKENGECIG